MAASKLLIAQASNGYVIIVEKAAAAVFETGCEIEMFQFIEKHFGFKAIIYDEEVEQAPENSVLAEARRKILSGDDV